MTRAGILRRWGGALSLPVAAVLALACDAGETRPPPGTVGAFQLLNHGGSMEGHTPRGFKGQGNGLFVGDNINKKFPEGEGTQVFLSFDVSNVGGQVVQATLRAPHVHMRGSPLEDLGPLVVQEMAYEQFSSALWNRDPPGDGVRCELARTPEDAFECDVTDAVARAVKGRRRHVQFRVRLEQAGDSDGQPDLVMFCKGDMNTNEPGCLEIVGSSR